MDKTYVIKERLLLTIECCIHATEIDQQADHSHILGRFVLTKQLVSEYLTRLTASGHSINVKISKGLLFSFWLVTIGKDTSCVFEDSLQEVILNISPPEW